LLTLSKVINFPLSLLFFFDKRFIVSIMSTKHFFDSADGLVDKAERGAIALNPALR